MNADTMSSVYSLRSNGALGPIPVVRMAWKESNGLLPRSALSPSLSFQGLSVGEEGKPGSLYDFRGRSTPTEAPTPVPRGVLVFFFLCSF